MKRTFRRILSGSLTCVMCLTIIPEQQVHAESFTGQENRYIKLCSSQNLSKSKQKTCKEFNRYLSKKSVQLKNELKQNKENMKEIKDDIAGVYSKIEKIDVELDNLEEDISFTQKSIKSFEKKITKQEDLMMQRMYAMQGQYNSQSFLQFLEGIDSVQTFMARVSSMKQIIQSDEDDIAELSVQKEQLEQQKRSLNVKKQAQESKKKEQKVLRNKYNELLSKENKEYQNNKDEVNKVSAAQKKIDDNLTRMYLESLKEQSSTSTGQIKDDGTLGVKIANKALSKQGSRYWWGAPGGGFGDGQGLNNPSAKYFDCSGLVAWAHRQSGVKIGRTTAAGYSRSGKSVSYSNLQAGDVITFNYGGGVAHIGIYIGNGQMVHASGKGSGTRGQDPQQCVKVTSIRPGSYFYKYIYNCRRLY